MRKAVIVSSPNAYRMNTDLVARAMEVQLRKRGFDVLQLTRDARPPRMRSEDVVFFLQLGSPEIWQPIGCIKVAFNFHPTAPDNRYGRHAREFFEAVKANTDGGWVHYVFEYNPHTAEWMREAGIPAIFCPIGYHEVFDNRDLDEVGEWGVHFIGRARGSRQRILLACRGRSYQDLWGEERRRYTRFSGIHLSLASYNRFRTCLTLRLVVLLASNARAIIHEKTDWCPLEDGRHAFICDDHEIPERVEYLKAYPEMAKQIGEQGRKFIQQSHRFDDSLDNAMAQASIL